MLVARRELRLTQFADELRRTFGVYTEVLTADLSQPEGVTITKARIAELTTLDLLVNSSGFGIPGNFADAPFGQTLAMIDLHVLASTFLCYAALPDMIARRKGGIINITSIGAFIPKPQDATYCATKAYLLAFSQALHGELNGTGVQVQALCPGFVPTEFFDRPEYEQLQIKARLPKWLWTSADEVVEVSLKSLKRKQAVCIPGFKNRAIVALARYGLANILLKTLSSLNDTALSRT